MGRRKGQTLVVAALIISLSILSTQAYIYHLNRSDVDTKYDYLSDYILNIEDGTCNLVALSMIEGGDWLQGWDHRVKITIDHDDIDGDLSDFPLPVYLSSSSGWNDDDLSFVFDTLDYGAERKRIAATTNDGLTQCYIEVEKWDETNQRAWLWIKVPFVSNSTDTELYLYYDDKHVDNSDYVGDSGSSVGYNVWDDEHVGVWHLTEDPSGTPPQMKNSVSDTSHGSSHGFMQSNDQVNGIIGGSIDFDGFNDYIDTGADASLDITENITMEVWLWYEAWSSTPDIMTKGDWGESYSMWLRGDETIRCAINNVAIASNTPLTDQTWHHVVLTRSGSTRRIYINGTEDSSDIYGTAIGTVSGAFTMTSGDYEFDGILDEIRLSKTGRSAEWIKASYESGIDDLVDYGIEETRKAYNEGRVSADLEGYLSRWETFVAEGYSFGRCTLNATNYSLTPYSDGIYMDWGTDGEGITSACVSYTLNLSDRGAEINLASEANVTTRINITGSYIDAGGNSKEVTVDITLYNEGFPARLKNATLGYKKSDIWTDPLNLGSYSFLDLGNGTYRYRFTDDIPGSGVSVFTQIYDRREIFVQAEVILSEG